MMKKTKTKISIIVLVGVLLSLSLFSACASKKETADVRAYETYATTTAGVNMQFSKDSNYAGGESPAAAPGEGALSDVADSGGLLSVSGGSTGISAYNAILAERKVIFNANVTVEVEDFSESYGKIQSMITGNGFVQSSNVTRDRYYDKNGNERFVSRGVIVIRVAREKFDSILGNIKGLGNVLEEEIYTDDVTDQFFDVESRLKILRLEEERLISYLMEIKDPETIFKYEKRLTEVRQEIERYTGTLRKWNDLVELSTITINLREIRPDRTAGILVAERGYWHRLSDKFVSSLKGTIEFIGDVIIFLVQALPVLVFLGVVTAAFFMVIRFLKKRFGRKESYPVRQQDPGDSNSN